MIPGRELLTARTVGRNAEIQARTLLLWAVEWVRHDAGEVPHVYGDRKATHRVCVVCGYIDRHVYVRQIEAATTRPEGAAS